jgi:hypothetical protein
MLRIFAAHVQQSVAQLSFPTCVNVVSGYGLDDRATGFRSPAEEKHFSSSLCIQTTSEVHSASYPMGTGGKEQPGCDADH